MRFERRFNIMNAAADLAASTDELVSSLPKPTDMSAEIEALTYTQLSHDTRWAGARLAGARGPFCDRRGIDPPFRFGVRRHWRRGRRCSGGAGVDAAGADCRLCRRAVGDRARVEASPAEQAWRR